MATSLREHDRSSTLWVLSLDAFTTEFLRELDDPRMRVVELSALEKRDPELLEAKGNRDLVEYYFTLSPCWPLHVLRENPAIDRITYVDADMLFFEDPAALFEEMGNASVFITEHNYPPYLNHLERCGRFNVGILVFRNDSLGRKCLERWRKDCLAWCFDRVEEGKYADQKYLDAWPAQLRDALCISRRKGLNLAPWNWSQYHYAFDQHRVFVDQEPLEVFHFARFRPSIGLRFFQSGQLEYGIMPWKLRQRIYGRYWYALQDALNLIRFYRPNFDVPYSSMRCWHGFWRALLPRFIFGSDWLRVGPCFIAGRFGFGKYSGKIMSFIRRFSARATDAETEKQPEMLSPVSSD
ncbi:MAG: hypothetical protein QM790_20775 [Nibricoccus sp.]